MSLAATFGGPVSLTPVLEALHQLVGDVLRVSVAPWGDRSRNRSSGTLRSVEVEENDGQAPAAVVAVASCSHVHDSGFRLRAGDLGTPVASDTSHPRP